MKRIRNKRWRLTKSDLAFIAILLVAKGTFLDMNHIPSGSMLPTLQINDRVLVDKDAYSTNLPFSTIQLAKNGTPAVGDVITFKEINSGLLYIKRIVGVEGDSVELSNHDLIINHNVVSSILINEKNGILEYKQTLGSAEFIAQYDRRYDKLNSENANMVANKAFLSDQDALTFNKYKILRQGKWIVPEGHVMVMGDNRDKSLDSRFSEVSFIDIKNITGKADVIIANFTPLKIGGTEIPQLPIWVDSFFRSMYDIH